MTVTEPDNATNWKELLARHGPALYRTAYRILGRTEEAEDCAQDVLVEILSRPEPLAAGNTGALLCWMVTRRSLDRLRSRRASREIPSDSLAEIASSGDDASERMRVDDLIVWLRSAVVELSPRRAHVFALRCFAGMSYEEIASVLSMERNTVGVILREARQELWSLLPEEWLAYRKARCGRAKT